ncbi:MAG: ATP-dependent helicase [Planctomycetota bacterium]
MPAPRPTRKPAVRSASRARSAAPAGAPTAALTAAAAQRLLAGLNADQAQAVTTAGGPLLVLAGAGTGKTRVITVRIAYLLARGLPPEQVLAVTFTNKAAREMKQRLAALVGRDAAGALTVGTFHGFCLRVLREHGEALGLPRNVAICDAGDQLATLRGVLRDLRVPETSLNPAVLQARISLAKNRLLTPDSYGRPGTARMPETGAERASGGPAGGRTRRSSPDALIARAWERYDEQLRRTRSLDFDDLLLYTVRLLQERPAVLAALQDRYQHVLVDEYQDTNAPQYEIVQRLAARHRNLCVVGDDDQSIYGWRGADVSKILGFARDFPDAVVVRLQTNYRSTAQILEAANRVIRHNPNRHEKSLLAALGDGDPPTVKPVEDEAAEADAVVREIVALRERGAEPGEFAILVRAAVQTRPFEAALRAAQQPYVLVGGPSFFDRKEVRDVLAYLRLLVNPDDEVSLLRILNSPPRGIGKASIDRILAHATAQGLPFARALDEAAAVPEVSPTAVQAARELRATLGRLGSEAVSAGRVGRAPGGQAAAAPLVGLIRRLLEAVSYRAEVERCYPDEPTRQERWASVEEVLNFAENYARGAAAPALSEFLERVALGADDERDQERDREGPRNAITLMTLHAAKGLEFPRVYLVGLEEGLLPHQRAVDENAVEEERRLMYVGITRAQRRLTLSFCGSRAKFGQRVPAMPSRFLYELTGREPPVQWRPALPKTT